MYCKCLLLFSLLIVCSFAKQINPSIIRMSQDFYDDGSIHNQPPKASALKFSLAKFFQDNMVLQRAPKSARIFGFSPNIGAKVMAQMVTPKKMYYYSTSVTNGPTTGVGSWSITLDPMNITDPISFKFISESGSLSLKNVLFGDVWLCSGQSNMEFTVSQMLNGLQEAEDASNYPQIRLFTVSEVKSNTPLYDLASIDENWIAPSAATVSNGPWKYFSAVCWLFGKNIFQNLHYPIGLVATDWGGTPVEAWSSPDALKKCHLKKNLTDTLEYVSVGNVMGPQTYSSLWNAMVNPLLGMTIYGAIWYQGEDDAIKPSMMNNYNCTFPSMIDDWRSKFSEASQQQTSNSFPFGFVQLAPNRLNPNITVGFPDIRWHQTADYGVVPNPRMPNTFMAVAMDLPDFRSSWGSIHPRDKEDVGYRLSLSGLAVAYNKTLTFQGPFPVKGVHFSSNIITIDYGTSGTLQVKNLNGFEVNCKSKNDKDFVWYAIPIMTHTSNSVSLNTSICDIDIGTVNAVRYAWRESPCPFKYCAVYSSINDLPAPPFLAYINKREDGSYILDF